MQNYIYTYKNINCIILCISKTVNVLNAHPNKEMLPFFSPPTHTHFSGKDTHEISCFKGKKPITGQRKKEKLPYTICTLYHKHISQKFSVNIFSIIFTQLYQLLYFSSFFFVSFPVPMLVTLLSCFPR